MYRLKCELKNSPKKEPYYFEMFLGTVTARYSTDKDRAYVFATKDETIDIGLELLERGQILSFSVEED